MANLNQKIDFELIWKKIHGELTSDQEIYFADWLNSDVSHKKYFESVKLYYANGSRFQFSELDLRKTLLKIHRKAGINGKGRKNTLIITLTSVAASILFLIYFQFNKTPELPQSQNIAVHENIVPGSKKAVLILADGTEHDLSSGNENIIDSDGNQIKNSGNSLEYNNGSGIRTELKYNTIKIPRGGEYFVILSDCTKVWLNSETSFTFPVQFAADSRNVELNGEAYFEVRKNASIPFKVKSGEQTVMVLGTEFNISSYADSKTMYTTLVKGEVEVSINSIPNDKHLLKPNEQSAFNKVENRLVKKQVDVYQFIAWKDGRFIFHDQRLEEIMNTLSKWYDVDVKFEKEQLKNLRFTGNLERYSDFSSILEKIERTNEVKFGINNKTILIN